MKTPETFSVMRQFLFLRLLGISMSITAQQSHRSMFVVGMELSSICGNVSPPYAERGLSELAELLVRMSRAPETDATWRDYCVQFLGKCHPRMHDPKSRETMADALWEALRTRRRGRFIMSLRDSSIMEIIQNADITTS